MQKFILKIYVTDAKKDGIQRAIKTIINKILIYAIKRIMKDHQSVTKDYENLFYSMKNQCKKFFTLNFRPYILILQYWPRVSCGIKLRHLNFLKKSPTWRILFRKSHAFTSALKLGFHLALTRDNSSFFFVFFWVNFQV